jgi:hypothetical protein
MERRDRNGHVEPLPNSPVSPSYHAGDQGVPDPISWFSYWRDPSSPRLDADPSSRKSSALLGSYYAPHELIGIGWYLCRYGEW